MITAERQNPYGKNFEKRKESIFKTAAQKSKLYAKYGKKLYMAAKNGVADPEAIRPCAAWSKKPSVKTSPAMSSKRRSRKRAARGARTFIWCVTKDLVRRRPVIVDCLTDNNQRTISEIRNCFTKTGSKLAANGSVAMSFDHLAVLSFKGDNEEQVMETLFAADVAVEDVDSKDGSITIFAPPAEFYKAKTAVLEAFPGVELEPQEITFLPQAPRR